MDVARRANCNSAKHYRTGSVELEWHSLNIDIRLCFLFSVSTLNPSSVLSSLFQLQYDVQPKEKPSSIKAHTALSASSFQLVCLTQVSTTAALV